MADHSLITMAQITAAWYTIARHQHKTLGLCVLAQLAQLSSAANARTAVHLVRCAIRCQGQSTIRATIDQNSSSVDGKIARAVLVSRQHSTLALDVLALKFNVNHSCLVSVTEKLINQTLICVGAVVVVAQSALVVLERVVRYIVPAESSRNLCASELKSIRTQHHTDVLCLCQLLERPRFLWTKEHSIAREACLRPRENRVFDQAEPQNSILLGSWHALDQHSLRVHIGKGGIYASLLNIDVEPVLLTAIAAVDSNVNVCQCKIAQLGAGFPVLQRQFDLLAATSGDTKFKRFAVSALCAGKHGTTPCGK